MTRPSRGPGARRASVLLVEDTAPLARTYVGFLRDEPCDITHVSTGKAARAALTDERPDAVILDLKLPDDDGLDILRWLRADDEETPVIVLTAHGSVGVAVDAMRAGASDFLLKPVSQERLVVTLRNHLDRLRLSREVRVYREKIDRRGFEGFIGSSLPMQAVYRSIEAAASSTATVFITGESGVGKEVSAAAIHSLSPRARGPFVAINCAAIPAELIESEIFGHVKGAFTGAVADHEGAAARADGGTLFLDEICEMALNLQTKLLRFIQTGAITRVGGGAPHKVDVRFVCATNRDPLAEVEAGRFREDLYYRLHVLPLQMPPLRERGEDVIEIAEAFLADYAREEGRRFARIAEDARAALRAYRWPGNVRQLQNVLRNAVVLNDGEDLTAQMLPSPLKPGSADVRAGGGAARAPAAPGAAPSAAGARTATPDPDDLAALSRAIIPLEDVERSAIETAIALCGGDVRKAAVFLKIAPATIYRKLKAWREET